MDPYGLNIFSKSCCVILLGKPETYRLAPLMASLLGRAYDTWPRGNRCVCVLECEGKRGCVCGWVLGEGEQRGGRCVSECKRGYRCVCVCVCVCQNVRGDGGGRLE